MLSAEELRSRALDHGARGRYATARRLLDLAAQRAHDQDTRARVELSLAFFESELTTVQQGLLRCAGALEIEGVTPATRGLIHSQLGLLHVRAGDIRTALEEFDRAEPLLDPDDDEAVGTLHLNRGNTFLLLREVTRAREDFAAAARHLQRTNRPDDAALAWHNLGYAQLLLGRVASALTEMDAARDLMTEATAQVRAVLEEDRAEALLAAGMTDEAAEALEQAAARFARINLRQNQAQCLYTLARVRAREDPAQARRIARRAMRLFDSRGSRTWTSRAEAVALAAEVATGSTRRSLVDDLERVEGELTRERLVHDASMVRLQLARLTLRREGVAAARVRLRRVRLRADAPLENRLLEHEVRAELLRAAGRRTRAMTRARAGLGELHAWQSSFGSLELQSALVGHGRGLARAGLSMALDDGRPEVVFEWVERGRGLATRVAPVRPPEDPEYATELQRLRDLRDRIRDTDEARGPTQDLVREAVELERRVRERSWEWPGSGVVTEPAALTELQSELAAQDALVLTHTVSGGELYLFAVTAHDAVLHHLGRPDEVTRLLTGLHADLDVVAGRLPAPLREVVQRSLAGRLERMSHLLLDPVAGLLVPGRPVLLVPGGTLAGTPWSMLPALAGHPVTQARSASVWLEQRRRRAADRSGPRSALLVAGPRVPRASEEVTRVATTWHGEATVLTGRDATVADVAARAAGADVLHVAAHGRHSAQNPLFSGLELADGTWFGHDIDQLPTVPPTVVLSACELGRSTVRWGEETVGMTVAWLHAGATCVVAAPAAVDDDVACEVLAATHAGIAAGLTPAAALSQATPARTAPAPSPFLCFGAGW